MYSLRNYTFLSLLERAIAQMSCRQGDKEKVFPEEICFPHWWKSFLSKWMLGIWWHSLHLMVMGIPEWCRTIGAGFTETLLPSLCVQVCVCSNAGAGVGSGAQCTPIASLGHGWVCVAVTRHLWELPPAVWDASVHCLPQGAERSVAGSAQGLSALFLGMCQEAIKQQNDCSFIARCTIVLKILHLNYYVLCAAELSSQILRWF